jgi:hypothetical protein
MSDHKTGTDGAHVGATSTVRIHTTNLRGNPLGESNGNCKYPDTLVAAARQLRATGMTYTAIGAQLGLPGRLVNYWCTTLRPEPTRVVVRGTAPPRKRPPGRRRRKAETAGLEATRVAAPSGDAAPPAGSPGGRS